MNVRILTLLLAAILMACSGGAPESAEQSAAEPPAEQPSSHAPVEVDAVEMDVEALAAKLEAGEDVYLLDVRNPDELEEHGMIAGSVNIPIDQLEERLAEVPKDKAVVTYCMRGGRASRAAKLLRENGYSEPIEYGGITAWKEAGKPVVQPGE